MVKAPRPRHDRLRAGEFTAAVVDIAEGLEPDLYPLLASPQVRAGGSNLAGYQDPALDPLLEAARKPGTPEERMAAWKALLAGLATREPMLPLAWNDERGARAGPRMATPPRLISGPGGSLLGCASMAPRRGPVSLRARRSGGRAEVAEW